MDPTDTMMERFNFTTRLTQQKFDAMEGYMKPTALIEAQASARLMQPWSTS